MHTRSHWEARVLHHETMAAFLSSDYGVYSNFTWSLFEDSGWYKVNYTFTNSAVEQFDLQWGRGDDDDSVVSRHILTLSTSHCAAGLGCPFVLNSCNNRATYPYLCDSEGQIQCTFDRISKVAHWPIQTLKLYCFNINIREDAGQHRPSLMVVLWFWLKEMEHVCLKSTITEQVTLHTNDHFKWYCYTTCVITANAREFFSRSSRCFEIVDTPTETSSISCPTISLGCLNTNIVRHQPSDLLAYSVQANTTGGQLSKLGHKHLLLLNSQSLPYAHSCA